MSKQNNQPTIQIALTPAQREAIEKATGKAISTLKLEALETRAVPALCNN